MNIDIKEVKRLAALDPAVFGRPARKNRSRQAEFICRKLATVLRRLLDLVEV